MASATRRPGIIETDLGSELILLDPETQQMFSLNPSGRLIWRLLGAMSFDAIIANVVEQFDVSAEDADRDARALLARLNDAGLVEGA
jgi:hypothetical protein